MKIRLRYNQKENLKVFYSTVNKMPNALDCENEYVKPRKISVWAKGRDKEFDKEFAYLSLWCPNQVSVDI